MAVASLTPFFKYFCRSLFLTFPTRYRDLSNLTPTSPPLLPLEFFFSTFSCLTNYLGSVLSSPDAPPFHFALYFLLSPRLAEPPSFPPDFAVPRNSDALVLSPPHPKFSFPTLIISSHATFARSDAEHWSQIFQFPCCPPFLTPDTCFP